LRIKGKSEKEKIFVKKLGRDVVAGRIGGSGDWERREWGDGGGQKGWRRVRSE
jgi:hypothetical protein